MHIDPVKTKGVENQLDLRHVLCFVLAYESQKFR